jgi:two-component system alkaline phosphatase synthesis response regulator PhoP
MPNEAILIIEDDPAKLRGLKDNFVFKGYRVKTAGDGESGLNEALNSKPDLIILDVMLPGINGYEICRLIRGEGLNMPIIMLTAKGQESDIILGLNLGADDYVTKPFNIQQLLARVNAFLRRRRQEEIRKFHFGDFILNLDSRQLLRRGKEVELTPKEFGLLALFVKRTGSALTRNEILKHVWGYDILVTARSVDRCVATLRTKIERNPQEPAFIKTIRDVGYRFENTD